MAERSVRERLTTVVGTDKAALVIGLLDEEAATRCRDADCVRRWPHSRIALHLWRHPAGAPTERGLFGRRCFNCGHYVWRRIHRAGRQS